MQRFTIADDGLSQPWHGFVWCNPPYSDPLPWCQLLARHPDGLLLIRSDLNSQATQTALYAADAMWASGKRIQFVQNGKVGQNPSFSTVKFARGSVAVDAMSRLAPLGAFRRFSQQTESNQT